MEKHYFVVDIETCPVDLDRYLSLEEEERKEFLNPIDSKIVAIGIMYEGNNIIFQGDNEKEVLEKFWAEWTSIVKNHPFASVVGFNIIHFYLPFITARSFIHKVTISPFILKQVIDLRDKINAYKYGKTRGKLKEYAKFLGLKIMDVDGSDVAGLCKDNKIEKLKQYLANDLEITDGLYKRAVETKIISINRW